jgi:uncharacterized protein (DUF433 family)
MRITVGLVLSLLANRMTFKEILAAYPYLEVDDLQACLEYGACLASEEVWPLSEGAV